MWKFIILKKEKKKAHTQKKSVSAVQIVGKWNTELLSDGRPKMADDSWDSSLPLWDPVEIKTWLPYKTSLSSCFPLKTCCLNCNYCKSRLQSHLITIFVFLLVCAKFKIETLWSIRGFFIYWAQSGEIITAFQRKREFRVHDLSTKLVESVELGHSDRINSTPRSNWHVFPAVYRYLGTQEAVEITSEIKSPDFDGHAKIITVSYVLFDSDNPGV